MREARAAAWWVAMAAAAAACGSSGGAVPDPGEPPLPITLEVANRTGDTWFVRVGGEPRGSVAAGATLALRGLPAGELTLQATNDNLRLNLREVIDAPAGGVVSWTLEPLFARLRVFNQREAPVEVLVDGISVGWALPGEQTVLDAVPAGQRVIIARHADGRGAVQTARYLAVGSEVVWTVPQASLGGRALDAPEPPEGMALVWMTNRCGQTVRVFVGGEPRARVEPGASAQIVVTPGSHNLTVQIEGVDTKSEHNVTLQPNQVAEWRYGLE